MEAIAEKSHADWPAESTAGKGQERRLETGDDLPMHGAINPVSQDKPRSEGYCAPLLESNGLGSGTEESEAGIHSQDLPSATERYMGVRNETQNVSDPTSDEAAIKRAVLTSHKLQQLINTAGLGEAVSERQLYEIRKQFPAIQDAQGRIHLLPFIAATCMRRKRARSDNTQLQLSDLYDLLEEQEYRCALTGDPLSPDDVAVDHIVPISEGGDFTKENSQLVSKSANRAKHTMSQQAFIKMCVRIARTHGSECDSE